MKLERIGNFIRHRYGWFQPLRIDFEYYTGKAEGDYQVKLIGLNVTRIEYFKTEKEAQEFAKEIMGVGPL